MNCFFGIPVEAGTAIMVVAGAWIGSLINAAIYGLAYQRRPLGPWLGPSPQAPPRKWWDRIPVFGWFSLRRESKLHGAAYWVRPLLIELGAAAGFGWLYWSYLHGALSPRLPNGVALPLQVGRLEAQYFAHVLLISTMLIATFSDLDERLIPARVTQVGTLVGLLLAALAPSYRLVEISGEVVRPMMLTSPLAWPDWLNGVDGLWLGVGCFVAWCVADMPLTVTTRRGWGKAVRYVLASLWRHGRPWMGLAALGSLGIAAVWRFGGAPWTSLLTALVGMAFAGGMIWLVRIIGWLALRREAMGFGDVMLMAMIGVFMGWQASIVIFLLAPFAALFISLAQWLTCRDRHVAFGPYLCLATLFLLLNWPSLWETYGASYFRMGWLVPQILFFCLLLMGGMLYFWRLISSCWLGDEESARKT